MKMLEYHIYYFFLKVFGYFFEFKGAIHFNIWSLLVGENKIIGIYNLCLSFVDKYFFIVASHLFSIWCIHYTIYKMKCKKCPFSFLFLFWILFVFFFDFSLLDAFDGLFLLDGDMYSDSSIKKFSVDTISPPKESHSQLSIRHAYHESTHDECMYTTIHDDNVILFERWDDLSFYSVQEICRLKKEARFRKNPVTYFFERLVCCHKLSKYWSRLPRRNSDRMSTFFQESFKLFYLCCFSRPVSTLKYDESTWKCMAVTDIWTHRRWVKNRKN